jgi:hypothetical protein
MTYQTANANLAKAVKAVPVITGWPAWTFLATEPGSAPAAARKRSVQVAAGYWRARRAGGEAFRHVLITQGAEKRLPGC